MRIAYGDLIGGISGDMFVAALLDLGLPLSKLKAELAKIPTLKFELKASKKSVHSIRATQFQVICREHEQPRSWKQIRELIERSKLKHAVKDNGYRDFHALGAGRSQDPRRRRRPCPFP